MSDGDDLGDDLVISSVQPRWACGGVWVRGTIAGHRFEALVFPRPAMRAEWELHGGRIAKLWLQRLSDGHVVFKWDRGMVTPARTSASGEVADFLAAGLADYVFHKGAQP